MCNGLTTARQKQKVLPPLPKKDFIESFFYLNQMAEIMENNVSRWILVSMIMASAASADERHVTPEDVGCNCGETLNRFGVSYRVGFNITTKFKNLGGYTSPNNPGPATAGADHFYDDGYNRVDSNGNAGSKTTFWGYDNDSQHQGNTIVMSSSSSAANGSSKERDGDPQHGAEITYNRQLGKIGKAKWGVEAGFGFTDVTIHDGATLFGNVMKTGDTYTFPDSFPPIVVPPAGYRGPRDGQGTAPVLGDLPFRTVTRIANGARVAGNRNFDADIYGLRVGPYLEIPLSERLALSMSGGLALLSVNSDFKYEETVSIAGRPDQVHKGKGSHSDILPGGYFGANLLFALDERFNLSAGAQYQSVGTYTHKEGGKEAQLDLGQSVFLSLGVGFSF